MITLKEVTHNNYQRLEVSNKQNASSLTPNETHNNHVPGLVEFTCTILLYYQSLIIVLFYIYDVVFNKSPIQTYLQVLFRGTYWCRFWGMLQRHKVDTGSMREACRLLETSMMQVFSTHGWTFCNRLTM
jgi:hypothetical protein